MAARPDIAAVRAWIRVPLTSIDDEQLGDVLAAETAAQNALCDTGDVEDADAYPAPLRVALLRRCARHVAARGVPLGLLDAGELGAARLTRWDPEIERLEAPHRRQVLG